MKIWSLGLALALISLLVHAQTNKISIGKVVIVKGEVLLDRADKKGPLTKDFKFFEGDKIVTQKASFIKIKMIDDTILSVGPNSIFHFKKYVYNQDGSRNTVVNLLKGKMRSLVNKKSRDGDTIQYGTKTLAMGVRGTAFLVNSYTAASKPVTDVAVVKGKVVANTAKLGTGAVKNVSLTAGKALNTSAFAKDGLASVQTLNASQLSAISGTDSFMPNIQNADGSFSEFGKAFGGVAGAAGAAAGAIAGAAVTAVGALVPDGDDDDDKKAPVVAKKEEKKEQAKKDDKKGYDPKAAVAAVLAGKVKSRIKGLTPFQYNLKNEPWMIRDAIQKLKQRHADGECLFYFYKKLPGAGEEELFRRERDCDDFEFDD